MESDLPRLIEELAANAWPAAVQQQLEGWRLRAHGGLTRRANSVWTAGPVPTDPDWPKIVETFYRRHHLPPRYQVSAASPPDLDQRLAAWGYGAEAPTAVQVAGMQDVLRSCGPFEEYTVATYPTLRPAWLDAYLALDGTPADKGPGYAAILGQLGPAACFLLVSHGQEAVGVGTAVAERGWVGLSNIVTAPAWRGRGIGAGIVRELVAWGQAQGATRAWLQVAEENAPALRVYRRLGFGTLYGYHYRTQCESAGD
jgi:ribosomal protein S18 acetylase RimI-like enzyme